MRVVDVPLLIFAIALSAMLTGCGKSLTSNADTMNTYQLMTAAAKAHSAGKTEDAGFLFAVGQVRFRIDKQVYPPVKNGADDPGVLKAALSSVIGQSLGPAIASTPGAQAKIAKRLAAWTPKFPPGYDPGWKYQNPLTGPALNAVIAAELKEVVAKAQSSATLNGNAEYVRLSSQLADARAVEDRIMNRKDAGRTPLSKELQRELATAQAKKNSAAIRMKEIEFQLTPETRWHVQAGWKAEDFFDDPQVIALCHAIETDDVHEMERLIAAGADVKAIGKNGMTPLLWAYPDRKLDRFECLLRHGADPNVYFESDFGVANRPFHPHPTGGSNFKDRGCQAGQTVLHLACSSPVIDYLRLVIAHGGDVNLEDKKTGQAPLNIVLDRSFYDMKERVELLLAKKPDVNHYSTYQLGYPTMQAAQAGRYDVALLLLESGADAGLYQPEHERKLVHIVLREKRNLPHLTPPKAAEYQALVQWLENHGESLAQAEKDEAEWAEKHKKAFTPEMHGTVRRMIVEQRKATEREKTERSPQ